MGPREADWRDKYVFVWPRWSLQLICGLLDFRGIQKATLRTKNGVYILLLYFHKLHQRRFAIFLWLGGC